MRLLGKSEQAVKLYSDNPRDPRGRLLAVPSKAAPLPYPVTREWCERVREALEAKGRGSQSRLAEFLGVSTSRLAETLQCKYETSDLVAPIHEFFGWVPPLPPTASLDAGVLIHGYERMTKQQREFLDEAAAILEGKSGDQARKALVEMLKAFHARNENH